MTLVNSPGNGAQTDLLFYFCYRPQTTIKTETVVLLHHSDIISLQRRQTGQKCYFNERKSEISWRLNEAGGQVFFHIFSMIANDCLIYHQSKNRLYFHPKGGMMRAQSTWITYANDKELC